jgi:hypothetical protein
LILSPSNELLEETFSRQIVNDAVVDEVLNNRCRLPNRQALRDQLQRIAHWQAARAAVKRKSARSNWKSVR